MFFLIKKQLAEALTIARGFRKNARVIMLTEPMWGIPFNLYTAYASVYMLALGCTDSQIGLIASVGLVAQMFCSLVSGYITDKLGRKRTTLIFDLIGWSVPTLLWAAARNFNHFLIAAVINSIFRIVHTSWTCLFVESTHPEQRVHFYSWIYLAGILAGFFAPLGGLLVGHFSVVPAVRGIYLFAFVSMTTMFLVRNHFLCETEQGLKKVRETRHFRLKETLAEYWKVVLWLSENPKTQLVFLLLVINQIHNTMKQTFLSVLLVKGLGFPEATIALFPAIHSVVMLLVFIFVIPSIGRFDPKKPLFAGLFFSMVGYLILILTPGVNFFLVILSTILVALAKAVVFPLVDSMLANSIDDTERAKILSVLMVVLLAIGSPFGYIGGLLSSLSERLPFVLLMGLQGLGLVLLWNLARLERQRR